RRAPVTEQSGLDVFKFERLAQQRIVVEVNLSDREIVCRAPVSVDPLKFHSAQGSALRFSTHLDHNLSLRTYSNNRRSEVPTSVGLFSSLSKSPTEVGTSERLSIALRRSANAPHRVARNQQFFIGGNDVSCQT